MPTAVNVAAGVKPSMSVSSSIFIEKLPVPSLMVTNESSACGVGRNRPAVIEALAIETNCPSNASGLLLAARRWSSSPARAPAPDDRIVTP